MLTSQRTSLEAGAEQGSNQASTLQNADGATDESHNSHTSVMAPSVQFNESKPLASPSAQKEAHSSRDLNAAPASPRSSVHYESPSSKTKPLSGLNNKKASSSTLRHGTSLGKSTSRASVGGSSLHQNAGWNSPSPRKSRANMTVVTRPAWARDDSVSPPDSPTASPRSRSTRASMHDTDPLRLSSNNGDDNQQQTSREGGSLQKELLGTTNNTVEEAEKNEAESSNPDRWWTFTLPQKYRSRLHEHHLRMAFHHERSRNNSAGQDEDKSNKRRNSQPPPKRRSSDSPPSNPSSDYGSETEMEEHRGRPGNERSDHSIGVGTWHGVAAGLGASGLLSWKQNSAKQHHGTNVSQNGKSRGRDASRHESPSPDGTSTTKVEDGDLEKQMKPNTEQDKYPTMSFRARVEHPDVFTVHQPATPGWASPWKPEERGQGFDAGPAGFFPRTESYGSDGKLKKRPWLEAWRRFLIHNPFVPLLFRSINIAFTSATLGVAAELLTVLRRQGAMDSVGASPLIAIIFAPFSLAHIVFQIWLEYFGRPIGLWTVQSKLSYTVVELVFICLWSAELSLCFDNYFTSTLICFPYNSPYVGPRKLPADNESPLNDPSRQPYLCRLQGALIGLVFVSLLAYVIVLTVSLFRIFVRVTGGRR